MNKDWILDCSMQDTKEKENIFWARIALVCDPGIWNKEGFACFSGFQNKD